MSKRRFGEQISTTRNRAGVEFVREHSSRDTIRHRIRFLVEPIVPNRLTAAPPPPF